MRQTASSSREEQRIFYNWYTERFKKHPIIVISRSIAAIIITVGGLYGGFQAISEVVDTIEAKYYENTIIYEKLERLILMSP